MLPKNILVLETSESRWIPFLREVFEDTSSSVTFCHESAGSAAQLDKKKPEIIFINPAFLSPAVSQKIKVLKQSTAQLRIFHLGVHPQTPAALPYDDTFEEPLNLVSFQKKFVQHLPMPDRIRVLIIDDEYEIAGMLKEFLEHRALPAFNVEHTDDGKKGLKLIEENRHDILILDIKMPAMDGREVYRVLKERKLKIPVIIFFDAISGDEMTEVRKYGTPAVVEKGGRESAMPEMMALIKKLVYFG